MCAVLISAAVIWVGASWASGAVLLHLGHVPPGGHLALSGDAQLFQLRVERCWQVEGAGRAAAKQPTVRRTAPRIDGAQLGKLLKREESQ